VKCIKDEWKLSKLLFSVVVEMVLEEVYRFSQEVLSRNLSTETRKISPKMAGLPGGIVD
jgi:hypothetical protein